MTYTSMSTKFQVVIPKEIRERFPLSPGQKFMVFERGGVIELVPQLSSKKLRGIFKNRRLSSSGLRDKSD